ncbi:MAG TPA: DJ-1/PfpI family protein [Candidatus Coprenecus avistercoris]|uniref:DJ-1/PfpI family protein n=1 Tax=Candidatus Coprenecus avistercoris TaxID=2840730 RepID=A0A9D1E0E6_9BACT|nr:DJ-1/PfpI family protein [Candidatus Coprenecus avistercoris]
MNTQPRAFLFLADGFEITEAMAPADILVRGGIELNIISISDSHTVTSAQRISVNAEFTLDEYPLNDIRTEDIMIFPGGMPGSTNLAACAPLVNRMQRHYAEGGTVAAICAAPAVVLSLLPLEDAVRSRGGLKMTCYEGFEPYLTAKGVTVVDQRQGVVADAGIISASGAGHAVSFGLKILELISGNDAAQKIAQAIML